VGRARYVRRRISTERDSNQIEKGVATVIKNAPRIGIWLYPDAPVTDLIDAVVTADRAGVDEMWIADEGVAREPLVVLSAAALRTRSVRLGIGITSPLLRHPGAMASSIATLDELSEGRAILGFGVGGEQSLGPFALEAERPVALIRNAIRTARDVFEHRSSERYRPPDHAAPARSVPIFVGTKGEQLTRLASREADGVFLSGFGLDALSAPIEWARSSRRIHVALYASVRFRDDAPQDPTSLQGDPAAVAAGLVELMLRHEPESIGLALVDGDPIPQMMESALEAIRLSRVAFAADTQNRTGT
jgi:5,10-methylenetetrahydromethanopterin reductase